ncbi:predicted hydrocarbon binding protein [Bacillus oleivorans]|uniref:Predicted hydrocarbon binding protein n=1 Tax=Bacillus oleivorans TaxID=1448271 RepID=A0A285CV80_9BACI|nr:YslB family protein [Bacillus oleivorans]SNX71481.1 predicted hydrocarbon binding protein [Bacillus oleivorans]
MEQIQFLEKIAEQNVPASSIMLMREWVIPELLRNHSDSVLYWSGKKLARSFPCQTIDDIALFFDRVGFGTLTILSEKSEKLEFQLSGEIVSLRFDLNSEPSYFLEAGFLAEQIQTQKQVICESVFQTKKRGKIVIFTVQWDQKDSI